MAERPQARSRAGRKGVAPVALLCLVSLVCAAGLEAAAAEPAAGPSASAMAVEFYHAGFDHYFISAAPGEISALDRGDFTGWSRTGRQFGVFSTQVPGSTPVCRFYIPPALGDSHFYSASPEECEQVRERFPVFSYETPAAMYVYVPGQDTGACLPGTDPIFRVWNQRADSNHRYVGDLPTRDAMVAKGYVAEGYGPDGVVLCAPRPPDGLRSLSILRIPLVPGALNSSASYRARWVTSTGITAETLAVVRLDQTLEIAAPWIPGADANDLGGGFTGTYTIVMADGTPIMPPVPVAVSALPAVAPSEAGYYTTLFAAVMRELLDAHRNQPYVATGTLDNLTGAIDDAYLYLLDSGNAGQIQIADRVAKAMLETLVGTVVVPPLTKARGGPWWGSPELLTRARNEANLIREGVSSFSGTLALGGGLLGALGGWAGSAALVAAGTYVAGAAVFGTAAGLVFAAGLNVLGASMLGRITDADLVPVARSFVDYGIEEVVGVFTGNLGGAMCGKAGDHCAEIFNYITGQTLSGAGDASGWNDNPTTEAQRVLEGIEDYATPSVVAAARAVPRPVAEGGDGGQPPMDACAALHQPGGAIYDFYTWIGAQDPGAVCSYFPEYLSRLDTVIQQVQQICPTEPDLPNLIDLRALAQGLSC